MTLTAARQVADAVLYEGYLLYPYRASSAKNQVRWQFGILGPEGAAAAGVGEAPSQSAEVVLETSADASLNVLLRFLQVQARVVEQRTEDGWLPVDELVVGGTRWIPYHEAAPRELPLTGLRVDGQHSLDVHVPGGQEVEELHDGGVLVGRLIRTRWSLDARVTVSARAGLDPRLVVVRLRVDNRTGWTTGGEPGWTARDVAARYSLVGTHLLLEAAGARFVSLLDGPDWTDGDTKSCRQERCWPVLVFDDDGADAVLIAPIILGDHPAIAPESAGDLFDATEIDEILTLRVMTMTDQERAEARGTDPRAAAILDRCDAMTDDGLLHMHGGRRPVDEPDPLSLADWPDLAGELDVPWFSETADASVAPETDSVLVDGVTLAKGSRVRLRPRRRADAHDMFLADRTAVVGRIDLDVDGQHHVAVLLEDDPANDLHEWYGRYYYFGTEEIEPLPAREQAR